jgi:hypothetical protein
MSHLSLSSLLPAPNLSRHFMFAQTEDPEWIVEVLLARMRQHLYPDTLPALASCVLKTLCSSGHNRAWWAQLNDSIGKVLREDDLPALPRDVLLSVQNWIKRTVIAGGKMPVRQEQPKPPFRSLEPERLVPFMCRLLNEWLPAELAYFLTNEAESGLVQDDGVPGLAVARVLDRLLVREHVSPETLEMLLAPGLLSPKLVYPADTEILRDVVLSLLGRLWAPTDTIMPATLLGVAGDSALPADYEEAVRRVSFVQSQRHEELRVPLTAAQALQILRTDPVRIGSVIVTMDGRSWQASTLQSGEQNIVVYTPGDHLRIDFTADHVKLTVPWPETPSCWSGEVPVRGPFELFGREWHISSWEIQRESTLLHLTFSRVLPIPEAPSVAPCHGRLRPAYVDMAWSEVECALGDSLLRNNLDPVEQMRRTDLIPLGRALYALAESVPGIWLSNSGQIETQLRAVRYHQTAAEPVYGRPPWRILPASVQANLMKRRLSPASIELLVEVFDELPPTFTATMPRGEHSSHPSQAA